MTKRIREGLGMLCVAAACLLVGVVPAVRSEGSAAEFGALVLVIGCLVAVIGFLKLAWELLRDSYTKSSSGVRSSDDT